MFRTVVTILGLSLAACSVGEVDGISPTGDSGGGVDPRAATFATDVVPVVDAKGCTTGGTCHGPGSIQNPRFTTFDEMISSGTPGRYISTPAAANIIITKAADDTVHQTGPYLSAADKTAISNWLETGP